MNKKKDAQKRKLTLSRETLHALEQSQLEEVNGGVSHACSGGACTCNTRLTCSTNLC